MTRLAAQPAEVPNPTDSEPSSLSRLIVVSNRQPYEHKQVKGQLVCQRTDGGLTAALDPVLRRFGGTWIAWGSSEADRDAVGPGDSVQVPPDGPRYRLRRVWLTTEEVKGGYQGYANEVLWPLCHITLDRVAYRKAYWEAYQALNRRFAETVQEELRARPGPVWIHDFHLSLVPRFVKAASPETAVSVFWHVPWPGPDVFRILPERREVLEGLLAADSLIFQTPGYARSFADCAKQFLQAEVDPAAETAQYRGHRTRLSARAISVDVRLFSEAANTDKVRKAMAQARRKLGLAGGIQLGLGVDRLDYTKGLLKRLWALDTFFARYPHYRGRFTFLQVAVPTRSEVEAYRRYREVIQQTVAEINARHGPAGQEPARWRPVLYLEGRIGLHTLVSYYRMADLALVSSVYDGMNLVAKEYVASQVDENGVLLISQMAGSAEELTEALIINPYDPEGMADAIHHALQMPLEERQQRMRAMRTYLEQHDVHAWVAECLREAGR